MPMLSMAVQRRRHITLLVTFARPEIIPEDDKRLDMGRLLRGSEERNDVEMRA